MTSEAINQFENTLVKAGLSLDEAELYISLLDHGAQTATELASNTRIKRTYVYKIVEDLIEKGLVLSEKNNKVTTFEPKSPDHLLSLIETKRNELKNAETELENTLSKLKDKYMSVESRPIVHIYEGVEGMKSIYRDTIKEGKDIFALLENLPFDNPLKPWLRENYVPQRLASGIHAKVILATNDYSDHYVSLNEKSNRTVKQVDSNKYPIKNEVNIYGNKVAFMKVDKDGVPVGFIIEHPLVAQTMKAWFDLAWDKI